MTDAPETIWICSHLGEYGRYFPEAVEAEGAYGGTGIQYTRTDISQERIDALEEHVSDLLVDLPCACGHDNPTDICMGHLPAFRKQQARIEELEASLAKAMVVLKLISGDDWEARLGEAIDISCEILAENMEDDE
jgi:nicotinamide riboside kinase